MRGPDGQRTLAVDPDAAALRGVRWRLAALTLGLVCALLVALGTIVYATTQHVLMDSLRTSVRERADSTANRLVHEFYGGGFISPGRLHAMVQGGGIGVLLVVADSNLVVQGSNGPDGPQTLADPVAAKQALQGTLSSPYSSQAIDANGPYLVYTESVIRDDSTVTAVVQTTLSEHQYMDSMGALLRILLLVSGVGLAISAAISALVVSRALQPIQRSLRRQRDFVADAAHELRTPLAIMRTSAELGLAHGGAESQTALEQTLAQGAHLTQLVDSLSLLARADSGVLTMARQPVDLGRLATETTEAIAILAEERDVRLQLRVAPGLWVLGDASRLRQLLLILLDNALKYTPDGGMIGVDAARNGKMVTLSVRDSGPGIDAADLPHLFDRFYRADRARSSEGMGLGLAIGRWLAEAHGGRIAAANAPEGGAVFTVSLPLDGGHDEPHGGS